MYIFIVTLTLCLVIVVTVILSTKKSINTTTCLVTPKFMDYIPSNITSGSTPSHSNTLGYTRTNHLPSSANTTNVIEVVGDNLILPKDRHKIFVAFEDNLNWSSTCNRLNNSVVGPIKSQGKCGACWVFATTCVVEAYITMDRIGGNKSTNFVSLSEQYTLNTSKSGNRGCSGGLFENTLIDIQNNGIPLHETCLYSESQSTCTPPDNQFIVPKQTNNIQAWYHHPTHVETKIKDVKALLQIYGPLVVAIYASHLNSSNIITPHDNVSLETNSANHQVVLVGYDVSSNGVPYWIIRNSWGASWGINGYGAIEMNTEVNRTFDELGSITSLNYNGDLVLGKTA